MICLHDNVCLYDVYLISDICLCMVRIMPNFRRGVFTEIMTCVSPKKGHVEGVNLSLL